MPKKSTTKPATQKPTVSLSPAAIRHLYDRFIAYETAKAARKGSKKRAG